MRKLFTFMAVLSVASVAYQLVASLGATAHNHYAYRHDLLDTNQPPRYRLNATMGLTTADLAKCGDQVSRAYRVSVDDAYRLGTAYSALNTQCLGVSALLLLTSILGLCAHGPSVSTRAPGPGTDELSAKAP